ncbi:conserved Plasmodium protein, unknown function [Plasmodium ovale]|uniref:Uncharacterized protein n=2 Tax=Plasmodium ovale TaxID=36330 RepID=A0A1A8WX11_PLAOA|nr:conserved Plasmodium protein, unknown function [Plasmodium ovale curtisi]SBS95900.1 conserved Plasmodium protein, unknown function [Plasmodium ovale curtisi]SCP05257.1 conserved Plasmodium protein, unknown function [Plasmodium ovale]
MDFLQNYCWIVFLFFCSVSSLSVKETKPVIFFLGIVKNEGTNTFSRNKIKKLPVASDANDLISKLDLDGKKQYITYIYHSSICSYCSKVTDAIKDNNNVEILQFHENSKLEDLTYTNKPIIVLMKNINREDSIDRSIFYNELNKKGGKIQVPALEFNDHIMYESSEIINFYQHLLEKIEANNDSSNEPETQ